MEKSDIGIVGLAVMGENLALNLERNVWKVSIWNRTVPGVEEGVVERFMNERGRGRNIEGYEFLADFVNSLKTPRIILMMVRAGEPVDEMIDLLLPFLSPGDILIDGGNSYFEDTNRRLDFLEKKGIYYIGSGISGGEEGAFNGASIMPGGSFEAWPVVKPILQSIAARNEDGQPCCEWIGKGGAGHYVKMIHNGIEYSDMQLIAETYYLMKQLTSLTNDEMSEVFAKWNKRKLKSYLIEITSKILGYRNQSGEYLIDSILDVAGQKGLGKWAVVNALELEEVLSLTAIAIFERNLSQDRLTREMADRVFHREASMSVYNTTEIIDALYNTLYLSRLVSYAQSFHLLKKASEFYQWNLNFEQIARVWQNGCIIKSASLGELEKVFHTNSDIPHLLLNSYYVEEIKEMIPAWKRVVAIAAKEEISIPAISYALNYFYSFSTDSLPMNLIQAQRDYFGAHTFERTDSLRGTFFHEDWNHQNSVSSSGIYNA